MKRALILFVLSFIVIAISAQKPVRIRDNFDFDWKFKLDSSRTAM